MRWEYSPWRKLYTREEGSFAMLPLYARALAAELLKFCDDQGRIYVGEREPWEAVARLAGAEAGERRLLRQHIPLLMKDQHIVLEGGYMRIRNFERAQEKRRGNPARDEEQGEPVLRDEESTDAPGTTARTEHESATSRARPENERSTSQQRAELDPRTNGARVSNEKRCKCSK